MRGSMSSLFWFWEGPVGWDCPAPAQLWHLSSGRGIPVCELNRHVPL